MKLLLVEDDPEICGMLKKFLEKENFEIITANDGEEACSKFRQETCDLVLLDLMLPKISGMDVLQQIRAQKYGADYHYVRKRYGFRYHAWAGPGR